MKMILEGKMIDFKMV